MSDVKRALERAGERFELASGGLERLLDRRSRRQRNRRIGAVVVALVIGTAGIGVVMTLRGLGDQTGPATGPSIGPAPQRYPQIAGTYTLTLSKDDPRVQELGLAGRYTMTLLPDGVMLLSVPEGFGGEGPSPSGISFRLSANQFTTNAFVNFTCPGNVGVYRWELDRNQLKFAPLEERCEVRQVLFSSEPWRARP